MKNMFATWFTLAAALAAAVAQELPSQVGAEGADVPSTLVEPREAPTQQSAAPRDVSGDVGAEAELAPPAPIAQPVAEPGAALVELTQLIERNEVQRADEFASALAAQLAASDGDAAVLASRAAWSAEQRAHLSYCGGLAKARSASAALALEEPDEQAARALEDTANTWFARAASAAGPGELRDRALAAPGVVLAWRGEREVRAAHSQAMLQRSPVPFGKDTPEREALLAARVTLEDAREALVVRLEHDWRDVDNRANLEWVARRLFEIERVIERADEQDEQQEQQEQQQENEQQDGEDGEEGEEGEEGEPSEDGGEPQDGEQEDGDPSEDGEPREDGGEPENGSPGEQGDDAEAQDSAAEERGTEAPTGADSRPADDTAPHLPATLGDVEVQRLLNRLAEIEKDAEQLRRRLRSTDRRRVEKDW